MTDPNALLPCPFCGGQPKLVIGMHSPDVVECNACGILVDPDMWNRRSHPEPQAMSAEEVREACRRLCAEKSLTYHKAGDIPRANAAWECKHAIDLLNLSRKEKA